MWTTHILSFITHFGVKFSRSFCNNSSMSKPGRCRLIMSIFSSCAIKLLSRQRTSSLLLTAFNRYDNRWGGSAWSRSSSLKSCSSILSSSKKKKKAFSVGLHIPCQSSAVSCSKCFFFLIDLPFTSALYERNVKLIQQIYIHLACQVTYF